MLSKRNLIKQTSSETVYIKTVPVMGEVNNSTEKRWRGALKKKKHT